MRGVVLFGSHLIRNVFALDALSHDLVLRHIFRLGRTLGIHAITYGVIPLQGSAKIFAANQIGVTHALCGVSLHKHAAVVSSQIGS